MNTLTLNTNEIINWFRDKGDYTHNLNYDLNENSIVMDLGAYTGVWAQQIIERYNPNLYLLEPIKEYYDQMVLKFNDNQKVKLLNVGVSTENKKDLLYLNNDGTSSNIKTGTPIEVEFKTIEKILDEFKINEVDLLQINIEGDEYDLLDYMIENNLLNKFKNIQIQFHLGIENDVERRNQIHNGLLKNNFKNKFDYPFVWESWYKI